MNELQKKKKNFRNTVGWKRLREEIKEEQCGLDPITGKKLTKSANLHHMVLDENKYEHVDNHDDFLLLNKLTHDVLHFCYRYASIDKDFMDRLQFFVKKMVSKNS